MKALPSHHIRPPVVLVGMLVLALCAMNPASATLRPIWYVHTGITGGSITSPTNGYGYAVNSEVACTITDATDQDHRYAPSENPQHTYPYDTLTYTWSATAGSWKNGVNTGQNVTWVAPSSPSSGVTITCTISDAAVIPPGETGNRNDTNVQRSVTVKVVKAEVKSVTFTSDHNVMTDWNTNYSGSGGTVYSPTGWVKDGANNPISHTKGVAISADVVICVEPSGISYTLTGDSSNSALDFTASGQTSTGSDQTISVTAGTSLPGKVDTLNESIVWKITTTGNDVSAGTSGQHKIYVTWGNPSGDGKTEKRINWVCAKADEQTTQEACGDKIQDGVNAETSFSGSGTTDGWDLLDGGSGDCDNQARLMKFAMEILGAGPGTVRYVYASTNSGAGNCLDNESSYCSVHSPSYGYEQLKLDFYGGGQPSNMNNYEGCCEVAGKYYAISPKEKATNDYTMLQALGNLGVTQRWCWWYYLTGWNGCDQPDASPPIP